MSTTLWNSTITRIGIDAVEIIHSGVFILFGSASIVAGIQGAAAAS